MDRRRLNYAIACALGLALAGPLGLAQVAPRVAQRKRIEQTRDEIVKMIQSWKDMDGIEVEIAGGQVLVSGRVKRRRDADRLVDALKHYPYTVHFIKRPSPEEEVADGIREAVPLGVQVLPSRGAVLLAGTVADAKDYKLLGKICEQKWEIEKTEVKVENHVVLERPGARPRVEVAFYFVELSKSDLDKLGVEWSEEIPIKFESSMAFTGAGSNPFSKTAGVFTGKASTELTAVINAARRKGTVRVHDEYRTTVDSGHTANYQRQGIIYIPVSGSGKESAGDLKEVPFGICAEITPVVRRADHIQVVLTARVSQLAEPVAGKLTVMQERASTTMTLKANEVISVWRTVQRAEKETKTEVPGLCKLPALGKLFQSHAFEKGETESALFIEVRIGGDADVFDRIMKKLKEWPED